MYARTISNLWLHCMTKDEPVGCGPYFYTVTTGAATAHTAFRTRAALLHFLELYGLTAPQDIPEPGARAFSMPLAGSYREVMHMDGDALDTLTGRRVRHMNNGAYTLGIVVTADDGIRTVHVLNPNVLRVVYHHAESRLLEDAGLDMRAREVIEWPKQGSGKWFVVSVSPRDGSYYPLHEGQGAKSAERKAECKTWLASNLSAGE